jgi:hypothetical protein
MKRAKLRLWQFSLRTLLLATTLVCAATGVYAPWIRPRPLELLVDEFNTAIDERRYEDAFALGSEARRGYPKSAVADLVYEKAKFARQIVCREFSGEPCCGTGSWMGGSDHSALRLTEANSDGTCICFGTDETSDERK